MKIQIDTNTLTEEQKVQLFQLLGNNFKMSLSGKEKSELLEARMRLTLHESRPETTDYDFRSGEGFFFNDDKVELKQFDALGSSPKLQQVKPALYNKILVAAEFPDYTDWWVITCDKISSVAGKENREEGKLTLQRQHKGNELEGQITFTDQFKNAATNILSTGPINYSSEDLGLSDEHIREILNFVKNY